MSAVSSQPHDDFLKRRSEINRRYRERNRERLRVEKRPYVEAYNKRRLAERKDVRERKWARFAGNAARVEAEWRDWFGLGKADVLARFVAIHGVEPAAVIGPSRRVVLATCRMQLASVLCRLRPDRSMSWVGRVLGGRDPSTIHHAIRAWPEKAAKLGISVDLEAA